MKIENYGRWEGVVKKIREVSIANNLNTYIVGGFVRDLLLKREPKDLDVMVDAEGGGMKLAQLISKQFDIMEPVLFPRFGTAKLVIDDEDVEFVAPRKEFYEENNRKPTVERGDLYADAMRRDFSVNALFINLRDNEILDLTGHGISDLKSRILRVTDESNPDVIMINDPLRMLRLVRQSSQLDFAIDPETYEAVKRNADKLNTISKERVQEELNKILMTDKPSKALMLFKDSGLLKYVSPELDSLDSTEEEATKSTKNVWLHTIKVVDNAPRNLAVRLGALLHDIGKPDTKSKTYSVTCDTCSTPFDYIYKYEPEVGYVCQNCSNKKVFKNESELMKAFPKYDVHFLGHENVGANKASKFLHSLRYSDDMIKEVKSLVNQHMRGHFYADSWTDSAVRRYNRETHPYTDNILELTKADVTSKHVHKKLEHDELIEKLRNRMKVLNEQMESSKIDSPLNGLEIMEMFENRKAGNWIQKIKEYLLNEVIEGRLSQEDKEGARKLVQNLPKDFLDKTSVEQSNIILSSREKNKSGRTT